MATKCCCRNNGVLVVLFLISSLLMASNPTADAQQLSVSFYGTTCPSVFTTVRSGVRSAINRELRMGSSIIRLFFHDCFVNGCDGSILLGGDNSERTAVANNNSARGFEAINNIKKQVDAACGNTGSRPVVSCADVLAIAARDAVVEMGGPSYEVPLGRRDSRISSRDAANQNLPKPSDNLPELISKFGTLGFSPREMVALSGAHTVGFAQCFTFRDRIYNETNIDPTFAADRRRNCPREETSENDSILQKLDPQSPNRFGNNYFQALMNRRGLLHSDQVLFNGGSTDSLVRLYGQDSSKFAEDFGNAMVKMGSLSPLTGSQGEIRVDCERVN